ncbi:MAG: zinc finger domain-containing protein, partial [Candidatus Thiodiazotropha endolucinida]|nr:zinc finger domain-containing protein [Candidatus Thiodiazotropha taylori]MCW4250289.1 zinc finger domain-containing protein [Candidatus Thiodiazotropha endolucinida]
GETVQVYAERLITLAGDAFGNQQGPATQRQLIDIFVDGLLEDSLKLKVLRGNPADLEAAITTATDEQNLRRRFNLRTRHHEIPDEERMEVDHYRPVQRCFKCHRAGHKSKDCRSKARVNAVTNNDHPMQT